MPSKRIKRNCGEPKSRRPKPAPKHVTLQESKPMTLQEIEKKLEDMGVFRFYDPIEDEKENKDGSISAKQHNYREIVYYNNEFPVPDFNKRARAVFLEELDEDTPYHLFDIHDAIWIYLSHKLSMQTTMKMMVENEKVIRRLMDNLMSYYLGYLPMTPYEIFECYYRFKAGCDVIKRKYLNQ